jgi:hypothetical protein
MAAVADDDLEACEPEELEDLASDLRNLLRVRCCEARGLASLDATNVDAAVLGIVCGAVVAVVGVVVCIYGVVLLIAVPQVCDTDCRGLSNSRRSWSGRRDRGRLGCSL